MLAGQNTLSLEMEYGQSVLDAFLRVLEVAPALKPHWLDHDGQPQVFVHVFLNGDDTATLPQGMQTILHDGDCLDFIPPVAGG